jgi:hypothetical protein
LTGLDQSVLQIKTKSINCHIANSKPVKQEVNSRVILRPLVFPANMPKGVTINGKNTKISMYLYFNFFVYKNTELSKGTCDTKISLQGAALKRQIDNSNFKVIFFPYCYVQNSTLLFIKTNVIDVK